MRVRVKRGREWIDLDPVSDSWNSRQPDGLDEIRGSRRREYWRSDRARELTKERVRRHRERAATQSYVLSIEAGA